MSENNITPEQLERLRERADGIPQLCRGCQKFMTENIPPTCDNCKALEEDADREMGITTDHKY